MHLFRRFIFVALAVAVASMAAVAQYKQESFAAMQWRLVGPHRAGRVTAVAGIPGKPAIYYFGTPGGGLWKTDDGGRVWQAIFDDARVASIGALAVASSDPRIIYLGTGEGLAGNGVYKSTDAGATWTHMGLQDTHSISSIIIDPKNADIVVAGTYDASAPTQARGVFKTIDGGKTWKRVLFKDEKTGILDMNAAPDEPQVMYAASAEFRFTPSDAPGPAPESHIFKSTDEGTTWQQLSETGLPDKNRGRIGVAVAPGTNGQRVYAIMNQGFFRSDDGGVKWEQSTSDPRVVGSGYFSRVYSDPKNADVVYVMQTSTYRSTDGGKTFAAFKGEPSGEDDHVLWIDPDDSRRIFMGTDQGAVITLNDGKTWTEWFNQPTGEMYHVTTDNAFPYRLYAAQQDSGSVAVLSRSDFGQITYRDWFSAGAFESGHIAPDPTDANFVYSIGWYGSVMRLDRTTGQNATVFAPDAKYRYTWETPLVFSPHDPKTLYVGMQSVLKTNDGGQKWQEISPDLTMPSPTPKPQGVIQAIAPSAAQAHVIWVGTSTGLVQLTRDDGANWSNVTPPGLPANSNIILIEASPVNADTAYAVGFARGNVGPLIYRTRDAGKTWDKIVKGLPATAPARVVREDGVRKGLLYAGTESGVFVSFNGGDDWQPLQLNLPAVSVRDLNVHGNDLVAATYGRGLWILDDISPLRQLSAAASAQNAYLFQPANAIRARWDNHPDTPVPPDNPHADNPPDGAIIYYYLNSPAKDITLEIRDGSGNVVRQFSNKPPPADLRPKNVPDYWFAPPEVLPSQAGLNRFVWNLQWPSPDTLAFSFRGRPLDYIEYTLPDHAIAGNTPAQQPPGPLAVPGKYEVVLTVDGHEYRQALNVSLDPRVHVSASDLEAQLDLARMIDGGMNISYRSYAEIRSLRSALAAAQKTLATNADAKDTLQALTALEKELGEIQDGTPATAGIGSVNRDLARVVSMIQSADMRPAASAQQTVSSACDALKNNLTRWRKINAESLPALNSVLARLNIALLPTVTVAADGLCAK
jgi:photosystem II stability/assembly factor-like uncharacterized protein